MFLESIEAWLATLPESVRDDSLAYLKNLSNKLIQRKISFLCGAGMSKSSGLPLSTDLGVMMAGEILDGERPKKDEEKLENPWPDSLMELAQMYPIEAIAEAYISELDPSQIASLLNEEIGIRPVQLHPGHKALEYLVTHNFIDRIYTTNFDTLIKDALGERSVMIDDKNADSITDLISQERIPIIHLHGYLGSECLLEESRTYNLDTPLAHLMMADMITNWFVWIGYNLSDIDLRTIFFSLREIMKKKGIAKRPFVVYPLTSKDQSREWRLAKAIWKSRYATFIPGSAEHFLPALVRQVCRTSAENLVEKIITKRGGNPKNQTEISKLWKEASAMAKEMGHNDEVKAVKIIYRTEIEE